MSYWRTPKGPRTRPPPESPEFRAYKRHLVELARNCDAADDGLKPCPVCGGTKGVRLVKLPRCVYGSGRHQRAKCPCGKEGPPRYGAEAARLAWNEIDRTHLEMSN